MKRPIEQTEPTEFELAKAMLERLEAHAAYIPDDYEKKLVFREELLKLRYKIRELIEYVDQSIILQMETDEIKKSECELCFFEWHQRVKKTTWDKGRLVSIVDDYHIPTKDIINLLYKNFQLSTNGLKEMGKAGETIIATCRLVEEGEGKTLAVRLKESNITKEGEGNGNTRSRS